MTRLIIWLLALAPLYGFSQGAERILYVVDSVVIEADPDPEEGTLAESDIETFSVVTNKSEISKSGHKDIDKVIYVITKAYATRPAEIKKIPTTNSMETKNGKLYVAKSPNPYTGPFINYYMNGKKKIEGTLKDGRLEGTSKAYFKNGKTRHYTNYVSGVESGEARTYFIDGSLLSEGNYRDGKQDGVWKEWYSTGKPKRQVEFTLSKIINTPKEMDSFNKVYSTGINKTRDGDNAGAVKQFTKAIEINPNYNDAYFARGTAYLNDFKFDEAINDFDKAIELEPLHMESISNRSLARIMKYEVGGGRTISKTKEVAVVVGKAAEIPKEDRDKICADLNQALLLGDPNVATAEHVKKYCK